MNKMHWTPIKHNYTDTTNMICTAFTIAYIHLAGSLYDVEGLNTGRWLADRRNRGLITLFTLNTILYYKTEFATINESFLTHCVFNFDLQHWAPMTSLWWLSWTRLNRSIFVSRKGPYILCINDLLFVLNHLKCMSVLYDLNSIQYYVTFYEWADHL